MPDRKTPDTTPDQTADQARQQTGQQQIRLRVDEREMGASYANAFRTNATAEEVVIDFGLNLQSPTGPDQQPEVLFRITDRIVLNPYSAKRLAITLGNIINRHEQQFGELELDATKRAKSGAKG